MVLLVVPEGLVREPVVLDALDLEPVRVARRRSNGVGPIGDADGSLDVALSNALVEGSWGALTVKTP